MDVVRTSDTERFFGCAAGLYLRALQPKRSEIRPLALGEFEEIETDSEGKVQCDVNSSSGLCY